MADTGSPVDTFERLARIIALSLSIALTASAAQADAAGCPIRAKPEAVPVAVALVITAAYWFTASTSFANPAVTIARALTDTFARIAPADMPAFLAAQLPARSPAWCRQAGCCPKVPLRSG
jgi:glycerol uptake facilitator-like aquaporin